MGEKLKVPLKHLGAIIAVMLEAFQGPPRYRKVLASRKTVRCVENFAWRGIELLDSETAPTANLLCTEKIAGKMFLCISHGICYDRIRNYQYQGFIHQVFIYLYNIISRNNF